MIGIGLSGTVIDTEVAGSVMDFREFEDQQVVQG